MSCSRLEDWIADAERVSLERLPPELKAAVERRAVALIRSGLSKTFPGRGLVLRRDGPVWKIIGDLSLNHPSA